MHDPELVDRDERLCEVDRDGNGRRDRQPPAREVRVQIAPRRPLHRDPRPRVVVAVGDVPHDRRMSDAR
jgi:hypothetical protein